MTNTQSVPVLLRSHYATFTFLGKTYTSVAQAVAEHGEGAVYAATHAKFMSSESLAKQLLATGTLYGTDSEVFSRVKTDLSAFVKADEPPTLETAILNNPDTKLAKACQEMFVATDLLMSLVRVTDFDTGFVSRKLTEAGVPFTQEQAAEAVQKLQGALGALTYIKDLLREKA
jgi:hypothetical protein